MLETRDTILTMPLAFTLSPFLPITFSVGEVYCLIKENKSITLYYITPIFLSLPYEFHVYIIVVEVIQYKILFPFYHLCSCLSFMIFPSDHYRCTLHWCLNSLSTLICLHSSVRICMISLLPVSHLPDLPRTMHQFITHCTSLLLCLMFCFRPTTLISCIL